MLTCTRSRGVVKGGRLFSASSTRQSSSQQQTFLTREGVWRGSEIGNNTSLTDCRAAAAALAAHHERGRFSTAAAGGEAAAAQAASKSSSSYTAAAAAAVAAAAVAGTVSSAGENEAPPREDTSSTFPGEAAAKTAAAAVSAAAASLLPRSNTAKCGGHRRIQDMYHMVDSPIGQGAFGVVCAGVHKVTGEVVAVKQIPRRLMSTPRLQAEVDLLRMAGQHKNVVGFRDLFSDGNFYYIVMEFATGGELFDRLVTKGAHSEHDAASLLREVMHAVAYLHGHSIIHFDIKPENILLHDADTDEIDVRLVDFGSAFVVGATGESGPKNDSGTIAYSAPEVLRGQPVSTAADMWSLGVVLYILLSGFHPFDMEGGANDLEVRKKVLSRDLTFDSAQWAGKEGAVDLINQLLDSDPRRRPTAEEVLQHPWMQKTANLSRRPMVHAAENLRGFHRGRMRLKACLLAVMSGLAGPETYGGDPDSTVGSRTGALKWMDVGGKGYISADDLDRALRLLGENLNDREVLRMMQASTGHPEVEHAPRIVFEDFMKLVPPLCPSQVFKGGSTIYTDGEVDRNFYLINRGEVALSVGGVTSKKRGAGGLWGRTPTPGADKAGGDGDKFVVDLHKLGRGSSFGEAELLAAAEAEEGAAAAAAALKNRQNSQKSERRKAEARAQQQQQQQQQQKASESSSQQKPVAMLVSAGGLSGGGDSAIESGPPPAPPRSVLPPITPGPRRKTTPGEGPGRGAARGGGLARATRAVCVSEEDCEVMAVPRHLFANLLDELGGVRRKLELQAKARAAASLIRLIEGKHLPGNREKSVPEDTTVWPPVPAAAPVVKDQSAGVLDSSSLLSGVEAGEARRMSRRDAPMVVLVREGSVVATLQDGTKTTVRKGEVCVCGIPRRGIPRVTRVTSSGNGAKVVEVPLESFRKGGLFGSSAALDAFLRMLHVGFTDVSE